MLLLFFALVLLKHNTAKHSEFFFLNFFFYFKPWSVTLSCECGEYLYFFSFSLCYFFMEFCSYWITACWLVCVCVCVCVFLVIRSSPLLMHRSSINHLILCDIMCVQVTENKINPAHQLKDQWSWPRWSETGLNPPTLSCVSVFLSSCRSISVSVLSRAEQRAH